MELLPVSFSSELSMEAATRMGERGGSPGPRLGDGGGDAGPWHEGQGRCNGGMRVREDSATNSLDGLNRSSLF